MHDIKEILKVLHYHPKWVEYGFIDQQSLVEQVLEYQNGVDEHTEHYRYASFHRLLDRSSVDDVLVHRVIELALLDEDQALAEAALTKLAKHTGLTEGQLDYLKSHPAFNPSHLQAAIEQTQLLRALDDSEVNDDLFTRCLLNGNDLVQRKLLNHPGVSRPQTETLAEYGVNRGVRNLAREKLRTSRDLKSN